jgi:competence protein ComEC
MGARIAFAPALAMWAGTLAGLLFVPSLSWAWLAGAGIAGIVTLRLPMARAVHASVLTAFALAGCVLGGAHARTIEAQRARIEAGDGLFRLDVRVRGPGARGGEWIEAEVRAARPPLIAGTRLRLRLPDGQRAGWGDRLLVLAGIEVAPGRRNPGGFDARVADFARGIAGRGRIHAVAAHDSTGAAMWTRSTLVRWRRAIERTLEAHLGETARAYATPLMTGDRSDMPPAQRARLRDAGLAHLLALSGLHVSWLAWLARATVIVAGGGLVARAVAGALSALGYLGLAGPLPSLSRAAVTECAGAAARASQRALDPLQSLGLAILALLAWRPGWALDFGFQLSCAATFGLIVVGAAPEAPEWRSGWRGAIGMPLRATGAAQLAATPLLVAHFHGLSWSVWVANLLAVPLAGLMLGLLWFAVLIESALPGAAAPLWAACEACAFALDAIAAACASLPFAWVPCGARAAVIACAAGGAVLFAAGRLKGRSLIERTGFESVTRMRVRVLGAVLVATAFLLAWLPSPLRPPAGHAWVVALDVGQGDAIALGTPRGWWLIDAGPRAPGYDAGESVVVPFFRWAGERAIEGLIVTHLDADHAGGAGAVWRAFDPAFVASPDSGAAAHRPPRGVALTPIAAGDTLTRDPSLSVLWPRAGTPHADRNSGSAVLVLDVAGGRALFTADADSNVEARLDPGGVIHLLKAGHHGARSSSGASFLARLRPREAVISAGRTNPFGHPHPETLARLAAAGTRVRRTDLDGAIWYELSEEGVRVLDWRQGMVPDAASAGAERRAEVPQASRFP